MKKTTSADLSYTAEKGKLMYLLTIGFPIVFAIIIGFNFNKFLENPGIFLPLLAPIALISWIFFDTHYTITTHQLICKSGFIKKTIPISAIKEIEAGKTMWVGLKLALASKGLIIKYDTYEEVYISPKNQKAFIETLLKINPEIQIR